LESQIRTSTHIYSATGLHVYERGGLTAAASQGTTPVARFAYCEHCDIEVPVDTEELCTNCFHPVPEDEDE
jgi:hypothetical protein